MTSNKSDPLDENHLFMVSTPLHLIVSIAIVDTLAIKNPTLIFIDQVSGKPNPYLDVLQNWPESPFKSISVFYRPVKSAVTKLLDRKHTFSELSKIIQELRPKHIYTGNDRRVEFQLCMHKATELELDPIGYYMDEGTFTYVGRKASNDFSDKIIDSIFKKLFYGSWWKHPGTVGASDWITAVYVSFPDSIHTLLKEKEIRHLSLEYWRSGVLKTFCELLIDNIGRPKGLFDFDLILTLPHESIMHANPAYKSQIQQLVALQVEKKLNVAVKYHPRDVKPDLLDLEKIKGVELIASALPFEALLPMLKEGAKVIGDFSTTLITTRLLRPDLIVEAIDHGASKNNDEFLHLYNKLGITIINTDK